MNIKLDDTELRMRRTEMVDTQLRARGIRDERVLRAFETVPRHLFVPEHLQSEAYNDNALPIGHGQTISQPYMVALMLSLLELDGHERVLEVGAGSGYQAALLGMLAKEVYTVERLEPLAELSRSSLEEMSVDNVHVVLENGSVGLPDRAPFDAIIVAAGAPDVPDALVQQLADPGVLLIPTGPLSSQSLLRVVKRAGEVRREKVTDCAFVPLKGQQGWNTGAEQERPR